MQGEEESKNFECAIGFVSRRVLHIGWLCETGFPEDKHVLVGAEILLLLSKLVYNLLRGLTTYLYRGYNPVAKYHGHPSKVWLSIEIKHLILNKPQQAK